MIFLTCVLLTYIVTSIFLLVVRVVRWGLLYRYLGKYLNNLANGLGLRNLRFASRMIKLISQSGTTVPDCILTTPIEEAFCTDDQKIKNKCFILITQALQRISGKMWRSGVWLFNLDEIFPKVFSANKHLSSFFVVLFNLLWFVLQYFLTVLFGYIGVDKIFQEWIHVLLNL